MYCSKAFLSVGQLWLSNKKQYVFNIFSFADLWGVVKTKKCCVFSDLKVEGCEVSAAVNCVLASRLVGVLPDQATIVELPKSCKS